MENKKIEAYRDVGSTALPGVAAGHPRRGSLVIIL